ncbi:surfeit locus protein 6 [Microcaecilia unicolor]|uniref:Surfeit locus protein 6 n=1 Tax=Microcaecilia unicolor TaxID=1415580 RepID=A0A6P7YKH9_9AMPH|nr:surfeit locus protein 6 [Microcaecilia unicolor]XP_030063601.1 surfeit locus protein 6 [Microcaecilia unicolor]XP_030063602.1 surfeit locus protein 6 [Microcaecilia unicolor]XP_030063603.1 surfeit locus protein 6 [Microcaecilia unicolor]XP_030063604.1 surfeit locus protein 6 [Microcaecilia unicolor]XP_030063605.1 surfeit locus protein 6 [Microcaecilia unicolor]
MASLVAKDSYFQSLAKKVCAQQNQEPRKRRLDGFEEFAQKKKKKPRKRSEKMKLSPGLQLASYFNTPQARPASEKKRKDWLSAAERETENGSFFAVDLLRERLHEKIQETRGQNTSKGLLPEELEKRRQRRKQERERKKRKRKKLREGPEECSQPETSKVLESPCEKKKAAQGSDQASFVFNKMEVHDQKELNQAVKKKKKESLKGNLTPLTGKNFKQLLSRLEVRKSKVEDLKAKDEKRAQELENKMKWTNVLYKAEGVKIKDNEELLQAALKRKEKRRTQRQKQWEKRTEQTVEKMQRRQDKRRRNIQKKKRNKVEQKKERARKKGRILPEDLK